jgi:hypothetical protein
MHLPSRELACGGGCRTAACGAVRTFAAHSGIGLLRWWTMPRPPSAIAACKAEAAGGRSGLGPRTHGEKPLSSDAPCPRLEGPALPDPPRPRPCSLRRCTSSSRAPASGGGVRAELAAAPAGGPPPLPAGSMPWGRAGQGPRGAAAAFRRAQASRRVFEGPALNGPTASALRRRDARVPHTGASRGAASVLRRKPSPSRPTRDGCTSRHAPRTD